MSVTLRKMKPTQRELLQLAAQFWPEGCEPLQAVPFARAVLARWGTPNLAEVRSSLRSHGHQTSPSQQDRT